MLHSLTRTLLVGFVVCLMQGVAFGQMPDWKWQNPLPTGNELKDVQFINSQLGFAVGIIGTIIKTTNGGQSWQIQNSGTNEDLMSVYFINNQIGWSVGERGTILKTTNSGRTWQNQPNPVNMQLRSVFFTDAQTGWAVGGHATSATAMLKTTNGGQSWQIEAIGSAYELNSVFFTDAQNGWIVGEYGRILRTSNGGQNWQNQVSGTTQTFISIQFIDSQIGWAVGTAGTIRKTTNSGQSWLAQASTTTENLTSIYFLNSQIGWSVGTHGTILKTTNGGANWQRQLLLSYNYFTSIQFSDDQTGWIFGESGTILTTTNSGSSWQTHSGCEMERLHCVYFVDNQTGWAVGEAPHGNSRNTILKTTNGGKDWKCQIGVAYTTFYSVHFANAQKGWVAGSNGIIYHTVDGGQNWQIQNTGTTNAIRSVYFFDAQIGWAVGDRGVLYRTSDGGQSWQSQNSGTTRALHSVHFIDAQTGFAVGDGGTIIKTSDGGISWLNRSSGTTNQLYSVQLIDSETVWVGGFGGVISKTLDGGINWQSQPTGFPYTYRKLQFKDAQNGWAVGTGTVFKTSNGGSSWEHKIIQEYLTFYGAFFTDSLHGWVVGEGGAILTTITNSTINLETPTSLLSGKLFEQSSTNCDPSNIPVSGKLIKADPGPYYAISKQNGNYDLRVPLADSAVNYTLQPVVNSNPALRIETVCPPSGQIQVWVDTIPDTLSGNNFGFEITPCNHLDVQLSSNCRRRCFTNSTAISYFNQGAITAPNGYIQVEFPKWVKPIRASRSYVAVNDSVWQFNLGDVPAGSGGQLNITDSVICGNLDILGLSQCTRATIFPPPNCPPPTAWSGAEVTLEGRCQNQGIAHLGIYNRTAINMPDSVEYFIYLDSIQVRTGKVKLLAGDSLKFRVETTGYDVHITAMQVASHPTQVYVSHTLEGCMATTSEPRGIAMHFPIQQQPNSKTQCLPIIGAYDPNDKQVFPLGFTANRIVPPNTKLEYLVRFQNTGNDTAFTVYIIDTLNTNLNVESFEMGAASHPFQLSMQTTKSGKTWLRWQFNNILLPDSNTNEPASNGFVQFRISPKANLPLGTQVYNEADIYFDFNPPILTNQTLTTFDIIRFTDTTLNRNVRIVLPTGIPAALKNAMKLYPNPVTNNQLNINFAEAASLTLYDARGQVVYSKANLIGEHTLPVSLKRGMYVARIAGAAGSWSERVVVE